MVTTNVIDFSRKAPWAGMGAAISNDDTINKMLVKSGANFEVEKVPELIKINGREIYTGKHSLVRTDKPNYEGILSSVPHNWNVNQNRTAFEFFRRYVKSGAMSLEVAGSLDGGRNVFILAKVNHGFSLKFGKKKDDIESYLLFSNPHRYGWSIVITPTQIRVACLNMLVQALGRAKNAIRIQHTEEFDAEEVHRMIAVSDKLTHDYEDKAKFLSKTRANDDDLGDFFAELFPITGDGVRVKERSRNAEFLLTEVLEKQPGAELGAGTWWSAFNAVTYFVDHLASKNDNTRLESALYGTGRDLKKTALEKAVQFAKQAA